MGLLRVNIEQIAQLGSSLSSYYKSKSKLTVRVTTLEGGQNGTDVWNADFTQQDVQPIEGAKDGRSARTPKFVIAPNGFDKSPCLTNPLLSTTPALEIQKVRFSAAIAVDLMEDGRHRPICRAFLSVQHNVLGVERVVTLKLYPLPEDVSQDLPATTSMATLRLRVTAIDFCPDPSSVDHVIRSENDVGHMERLRLFYLAYTPSRLPVLDVAGAAARDAVGGWESTFRQLLAENNYQEPLLRTVRVTIKGGKNFPQEGGGYIDPYIQLSIVGAGGKGYTVGGLGDVFQTATLKNQCDPVFNETFEVKTFLAEKDSLRFRLWDYDFADPDDLIGDVIFPMGLLLRGVPTTRSLYIGDAYKSRDAKIEVVLHALDFGLDPQAYGDVVNAAITEDLPRLDKFYERYGHSARKTLESELILHSLTPGSFEEHMRQLVATNGLEPGKDTIRVSILALQNVLLPKTRAKVDLTKQCTAPGEDTSKFPYNHTTQPFQIKINGMVVHNHRAGGAHADIVKEAESASPARIAFKADSFVTNSYIRRPEIDTIRIEVLVNRRHKTKGVKEKPKCDVLVGSLELCASSLVLNQTRTRTYSLVCSEHGPSDSHPNWFNGSITVSLMSEFIGSPTPSYSCLADDEVEATHRRRLGGLIRRYENHQLTHLDTLLQAQAADPQRYMDDLVRKYGPEPGTYRVQFTVDRCEGLPRVELSGAGVDAYVLVETSEEKFATRVVASRSPLFQETFELDIRNPFTEVVKLTVMDYDANSDDDPIAVSSMPVKSFSASTEDRLLPLFAHDDLSSRVPKLITTTQGTIRVSVRAIGFGPQSPFVAPEVADAYRQRLLKLHLRYQARRAYTIESLLWRGVDERHYFVSAVGGEINLQPTFQPEQASLDVSASAEQAIADFVRLHGVEKDNGKIRVSVLQIEGLMSNKPDENFRGGDERFLKASVDRQIAAPIITSHFVACGSIITDPLSETRECENIIKQPRSGSIARDAGSATPSTYNVNFEFTIDLERPSSDLMYLSLCGLTPLGVASVSVAALIRGPTGASRRLRVPIVRDNNFVTGWVTLTLSSDVVGMDPALGIVAVPEGPRREAAERLVRYYERYAPESLQLVDQVLARTEAGLWLSSGAPSSSGTEAFADVVMRTAISQLRGIAELGTFRLFLQVSACANLPRIEVLTAGDPYILVTVEGPGGGADFKPVRTAVSKPTINPKFPQPQEMLTIDFVHRPDPNKTNVILTVMDYDSNSKDDEWCRVVVPLKSLWYPQDSAIFSLPRTIPVVPIADGLLPNYTKTLTALSAPLESGGFRTSTYTPPTITFSGRCVGFGATAATTSPSATTTSYVDAVSPQLTPLRQSLFRLLHRHYPTHLPNYEPLVWGDLDVLYGGDAAAAFDVKAHATKVLASTEATFGKVEGGGLVTFTVHSIEKLVKGSNSKPAKSAKPYVTFQPSQSSAIFVNNETIAASELASHRRTKTQKATPGPNHMSINETLVFDLANPDDRGCYMSLLVEDDVVGPDYNFGLVVIYFGNHLFQNGVPRKRTYPIVHNAGTSEASVAGYITLTITANGIADLTPIDEETQNPLLKRIFAMYKRYQRASMHQCDSLCGFDRMADLDKLVLRHGPEPGTFRALITIHGCEQLPRVEALGAGCDPYVEITHGGETVQTKVLKNNLNPTFEETFEVDIIDPVGGVVTLTVMDYDAGDEDDPVARLHIPVTSMFGENVKRTYPLPLVYDVFQKVKKRTGSITVSMRALGFGLHEPLVPITMESDIRNRIAAVHDFYSRSLPESYETDMWRASSIEDALRAVVSRCGPEPGSRSLTITIDAMEGLLDGNAKLVDDATPYVSIAAPNALGGDYDIQTKTSTSKGANQPNYNQSVTIELANPNSDVIVLQVMNDVMGSDYNFGKVCISANLLQKDVPKKRRVPIIKIKEGGREAQIRGYLTVTLLSNRFGRNAPWDEEAESTLASRLFKLYSRHRPALVEQVDGRVATHLGRWEKYLADEVVLHGAEPGTFTLQLQFRALPVLKETTNSSNTVTVSGEAPGTTAVLIPDAATTGEKTYVYAVDLVSRTETILIEEKDKSGRVLRQANFPISWVAPNGQPHRRMVTLVPTQDAGIKLITADHLQMMEVVVTSTTCGSASGSGEEVEDTYRKRLQKLLLRSHPTLLLGVDGMVLGEQEERMTMHLNEYVSICGAEAGQTTFSVAIRSIDEIPANLGTSAYAKVYMNTVPLGKRLAAETQNAPANIPPVFSTPMDVLRLQSDLLQVKLGTVGFMKSAVLGRGAYPLSLVQLGHRVDSTGMDPTFHADNVFEVRVWVFDEEQATRPFVGRVTLWIRVNGFPSMPPADDAFVQDPRTWGRFGGPSLGEAIVAKELIAGGWWRSRPAETQKSVSDYLYMSASARPFSTAYNDAPAPVLSPINAARAIVRNAAPSIAKRRISAPDASLFFLHVVGCRGLPKMDTFGTCDTFVELNVLSRGTAGAVDAAPNQRTSIQSGTLNPNFRFHRDDLFSLEVVNAKQLSLLPLAAAVPAQDTTVPPVVAAVQQLTQAQQSTPQVSRPSIQLLVKDKDPGSEELIGTVELSMEILAGGFYHVNPAELLALSSKGTDIADWIAANEARLLRLPIILPSHGTRGEILLATSTECLVEPNTGPYVRHALAAAGALNASLATASKIFTNHKCWTELQSLHPYMYEQLFCSPKINQKLLGGAGSLEERCGLLMQSLVVEYGTGK